MMTSSILNHQSQHCPLCQSSEIDFYQKDKTREYFRCKQCDLVFVSENYFLDAQTEKSRYDFHENSPNDPDYRKFLSRIFKPLSERLKPRSLGLDFGCGPGPTLSVMFEELGHNVKLYDVFYKPDSSVLSNKYDFITATEVVEHLYSPYKTLHPLRELLSEQGYLGIMTKLAPETAEEFLKWHYKNDDTHVCFYSQKTFKFLSNIWGLKVDFIGEDVILFGGNI